MQNPNQSESHIEQSEKRIQVYEKTTRIIVTTLAVTSFNQKVFIQASLMTASLLCCKHNTLVGSKTILFVAAGCTSHHGFHSKPSQYVI